LFCINFTDTTITIEAEDAKKAEDAESAVGIARLTKSNLVKMSDEDAMEIGDSASAVGDTSKVTDKPITDTPLQNKAVQGYIKGRNSHDTTDASGTPLTDFYATPEKVAIKLFDMYYKYIPVASTVYSPCDGGGDLSKCLERLSDKWGLGWTFIRRDIRGTNGEPGEDYQ
jgi:hypothetical protein